jgi:hypothetical protein
MRRLRRAWWRWRLARLNAQVARLEVIIRASKETGYDPGASSMSGSGGLRDRCEERLKRASFRVRLVAHRLFELAPARQLPPAAEPGDFEMFEERGDGVTIYREAGA